MGRSRRIFNDVPNLMTCSKHDHLIDEQADAWTKQLGTDLLSFAMSFIFNLLSDYMGLEGGIIMHNPLPVV
jgi:hypothetical protein